MRKSSEAKSAASSPPVPARISMMASLLSPASGLMCHNFGVGLESPPIPADFFGPGSDPFVGQVCLAGVPLGPTAFGTFGDADTIIRRTSDPFDADGIVSLPAEASPVSIEIVALSLVSVSPITVTYSGGQDPELWSAAVDLSDVTPAAGMLMATKTHCNGGTYTSQMNVQPRFTFTKDGGGATEILDTGLEGIPAVTLIQDIPTPWTHAVGDSFGLMGDPCSEFHAGVSDAEVEFESCVAAPDPIPTVSEWGLVVVMLLLLAGGTAVLVTRRTASA